MIIVDTYAQALKVDGLIHIVPAGAQFHCYQTGDALPPVAVMDNTAANARDSAIESDIASAQFGSVQPATIAQLKAMTLAQYGTWFDANFTTNAQLIALLKRLVLIVIRRVL